MVTASIDVILAHFDMIDANGHRSSFGPNDVYVNGIVATDPLIGTLVEAVKEVHSLRSRHTNYDAQSHCRTHSGNPSEGGELAGVDHLRPRWPWKITRLWVE